jgi:hypothetical protein
MVPMISLSDSELQAVLFVAVVAIMVAVRRSLR